MATQPYLVVRLVPEAPTDGATFSTYLEGLQLQVFDAFTGAPLSDLAYSSPLSFYQWPLLSDPLYTVSSPVSSPADYDTAKSDYGSTLNFDSTQGISVGAYVMSADQTTIPGSAGITVAAVTAEQVTLSGGLPNYVPSGTVVTFIGVWPNNNPYGTSASAPSFTLPTHGAATTLDGATASATDLPSVLTFLNTVGVTVGMNVAAQATFIAAGTTVAEVTATTVTVAPPLISTATPATVTFSLNEPYAYLELKETASTKTTLTFASTNGIAVGMALTPQTGIPAGVVVTAVTATEVTIAPALPVALAANQNVSFTFPLSIGIAQHFTFDTTLGFVVGTTLDSVATAIIPLNLSTPNAANGYPPMPDYLNVKVSAARASGANRSGDVIPINEVFYNVLWQEDELPATNVYQSIPGNETSLYITLPPQPGTTPIPLAIPTDGSAPVFDQLYNAMITALTNDPFLGVVSSTNSAVLAAQLIGSTADCTRVAYDIVWSYQNPLPTPPDPLESLYTNPPNPGNSSTDSKSGNAVLEQDRQKFEGTLSSFYATRNATAERLAKFVAAASAAVFCEQTSLYSPSALLEFPVNPAVPFASAVESEVLLQGLGGEGTQDISFGVPAAFFYALGAKMDKSTTAQQRYQMATGDAIDRLLQEFAAAEDAGTISDAESFSDPHLSTTAQITSFQAARRLVALGVSAASTSPAIVLNTGAAVGSPEAALESLVSAWLLAKDATASTPQNPDPPQPNPPLSYENKDFNIWSQQLAASNATGYLMLDLYALTQGSPIPAVKLTTSSDTPSGSTLTFSQPSATVTAPSQNTTSGSVLTFAPPDGTGGIVVGMAVSGPSIAAGTVVQGVTATTVTLSKPVSGEVLSGAGAALTFTSSGGLGIAVGMPVSGTHIAVGTTVKSVTTSVATGAIHSVVTTSVELSAPVSADVPSATTIQFNLPLAAINAATSADTPSGNVLPFATSPATLGIQSGMTVTGSCIAGGATVTALGATSVTLSTAVLGDVPNGSIITFTAPVPPNALPTTLADQIFFWLPSTTNPATPNPIIATLIGVSALQWTAFFNANPSWLPSFTQPVAPGSTSPAGTQSAGYLATRIRAFIRAVQKFFTVSSVPTSSQDWTPGEIATFSEPSYDPITLAVQDLPGTFSFVSGTTSIALASDLTNGSSSDLTTIFPSDTVAQAWLLESMVSINELTQISQAAPNPVITGYTLPNPVSLSFSVAEALYARGFRGAAQIAKLSQTDFQQALIGTVAYDFAAALYTAAGGIASASSSSPPPGFQPINADGQLTNCIPPPCLSPTGPIAYLQELLKLSESSTCEHPFVTAAASRSDAEKEQIRVHAEQLWEAAGRPTDESVDFWLHAETSLQAQQLIAPFPPPTLGSALTARRGPLSTLLATCANVETRLPLIDIVNESLEFLGAAPTNITGTVYATAADELAGFKLCPKTACEEGADTDCVEPQLLFAALPEHSTPAAPRVASESSDPAAYNNVKIDFSSCELPYSQALDVSRSYLRCLGSTRFETLRTFRKCITEFALLPANPPAGFESFRRRFPVRLESAIEYIGITPEEYSLLFQGTAPQSCASQDGRQPTNSATAIPGWELYGFPSARSENWATEVSVLSEFLSRTCLSYCEFLELWAALQQSSARYASDGTAPSQPYPKCEPCCLKDYRLQLPEGKAGEVLLVEVAIFIRLWRTLKRHCGADYSFAQLFDICTVLNLFNGGALNPEFIRQLAAFQMLRDMFDLPLSDPTNPTSGATGADRTQLLALWVGSGAKSWNWAVARLLDGVHVYAERHFGRPATSRDRGRLAEKLDALSRLAGFNPPTASQPSTDTWNSDPACTLRFAEVLAKIVASDFKLDELLYLFNAEPVDATDGWFAELDPEDAEVFPLDLPAHADRHSLWTLRAALLAVEVRDEEIHGWTWPRIIREMREHFGYAPPTGQEKLLSLGQHFFPCALEAAGFSVTPAQRQYRRSLTSTAPWNTNTGPFNYDATAAALWQQLPLRDEAVAAQLSKLPELVAADQAAVSDLYFSPRSDLAQLAFLFPDWQEAEAHLIEEGDEGRRWWYFRRHVALAHARRKIIARHLAAHVAHRTDCGHEELEDVAALVLSQLWSDENTGSPWESDSGVPPTVMWLPPAGGAMAALLGLVGTGLVGEYEIAQASVAAGANAAGGASTAWQLVWRDVRAPMEAFGHPRDATNSPVPTVLPPLGLSLAGPPVTVQNGYATSSDGHRLGGAAGFRVRWSGMLLIEHDGDYAFHAGAPTPEGELPDFHRAESSQWRVTLQRGPKPLLVLNHQWPGETASERCVPRLRRGAYRIVVEFAQPAPILAGVHGHPQQTSFQLKYAGPDSCDRPIALPVKHLYRDLQDATLDTGIGFLAGTQNAKTFLNEYYTGTLRDFRRTYQRAFKAVLFCGGLRLSAKPTGDSHQSELGFMLANPTRFAGSAYYRTGTNSFAKHLANFDFNFLPISDDFHPAAVVAGDRSAPSLQRTQAMFDWWERLFDYAQVRSAAARLGKHNVWQLFQEALEDNPANAAPLLNYLGVDHAVAPLDLRYYQDQASAIYTVSSGDLTDDRWLVRVWYGWAWLRALQHNFHPRVIAAARPDLWVAVDPSAPVPASGATETGNENLTALLNAICLANGEPRLTLDLKRVNDGLRTRGRAALLAYLCAQNRVALPFDPGTYATAPQDLADLLLLDVQTGVCESASRIEEAITAVQSFVRRARLGLEPDWKVHRGFAALWDSCFANYRLWERAKRRELYPENWIEWDELGKARRIEAFRFLETQLRSATLTLAAPGGSDWWVDDDKALEFLPPLIQRHDPSEIQPLVAPPQSKTREGLATLGTPEHTGEPSWLAAVPPATPAPTATQDSAGAGSVASGAQAVQAAAVTSPTLPLWMQAATKLGVRFLRIAAAGAPQAALPFAPHGEAERCACCRECGETHPVLMDEYYFWLVESSVFAYTDQTDSQDLGDASFTGSYQFGFQDSFYDQVEQQSAEWDDEDQVPKLIASWQPNPAVRLAWCQVHNGQFSQPRKSELSVQIAGGTGNPSDLVFLGRGADSLYFAVSNPALPLAPGYTDKSPPGFRYDLPTDSAVVTPEVIPAPPVTVSYPPGLHSYPFYAYHDPGAPLFPRSWFAPALAVADTLRAHCGFELALKWYSQAFNPLQNDCTWMNCPESGQATTVGTQGGSSTVTGVPGVAVSSTATGATTSAIQAVVVTTPPASGTLGGACCDSASVTTEVARQRTLTLRYCETLLEWGDALMRHRPAPEAFAQARLLYSTVERITGRRPVTVLLQEQAAAQPIASFKPAFAPLNPRLLDLYSRVDERLRMLHACVDSRRLREGWLSDTLNYFGDDALRQGWRTALSCADEVGWCHLPSPYRFTFLIQKAIELAGRVRELGGALLAAYEKGDAEYLASLRAGQERELLALGLSVRQDQWRDADWQVQALQQTKDVNQTNLLYYNGLYQNGLLNNEIQNISLSTNAMQMRTSANITEAFGEAMKVIPDIFVGFCSTDTQVPVGTKLAGVFETIAKVMMTVADVQSATAAIDLTEAGWQRRSDDWFHQTLVLPIEIQQTELQILGAQRRRDQALQELNNQQRQIENSTEVLDFLRDKFTSTELYLWLQKETAALHRQMYELAHRTALQAQRAYNLERGHTARHFVPECTWDDLHAGLLAGERLESSLHHMEKAYLDENVREYELTKHFSLRLQFPMAFLRLRTTGHCVIDIPEWMFDLDYPGQYMRRIRDVKLTIACVTGPYTGVHCRLTLLSNVTRIDPRLSAPVHDCCCPDATCGGCDKAEGAAYTLCADDPRMVKIYGARDSIATSSGQGDSGLHELSFNDPRYLPFEFMGAVSRWRIELPPENNYFDPNTLTDLVLHLDYTSREGGEPLRKAASLAACGRLPGDGWAFFDLRHDFPDAWELFRRPIAGEGDRRELALHLRRRLFPYLPGNPQLRVTRFMLLCESADVRAPRAPQAEHCCCPEEEAFGSHVVTLHECADPSRRDEAKRIVCRASEQWPKLFSGVIDADLLPFQRSKESCEVKFGFTDDIGEVVRAYLFCRYEPVREYGTPVSRHAVRSLKPVAHGLRSMLHTDVVI